MLAWVESHDLDCEASLRETIMAGFNPPSGGEDAFDATIGCLVCSRMSWATNNLVSLGMKKSATSKGGS